MFSYGFYPLIKSPTRVTITTTTLIEKTITNENGIQMENGIMVNDKSDHLPIFFLCWNTKMSNVNLPSCHMNLSVKLETDTLTILQITFPNVIGIMYTLTVM